MKCGAIQVKPSLISDQIEFGISAVISIAGVTLDGGPRTDALIAFIVTITGTVL